MRFAVCLLSILILSLPLQLFLPWWSILIAAALVGAIVSLPGIQLFVCGFVGTAAVWWGYAWMIDVKNQSILSSRIADLFNLGSPHLLILIGGALAGLVGGLAATSGGEIRKLIAGQG